MKNFSLSQRLLFAASSVLTIFLGLTAVSVNNAFQASHDVSQQVQLKNYLYMLLTAAEFNEKGDIQLPDQFAEPALSTPNSGLYVQIFNPQGMVWQSTSMLGQELPLLEHVSAPYESYSIKTGGRNELLVLSYGIIWVNTEGNQFEYSLHILRDLSASQQEKVEFSLHLWYWLGGVTLLLLIVQLLVLKWSLNPLNEVANNLTAIERGEEKRLSQDYPRELSQLTQNLNTLLDHEESRRLRYKHALADLAHSLKTPLAVIKNEFSSQQCLLNSTSHEQLNRVSQLIDYQLKKAATEGSRSLQGPISLSQFITKISASLDKVYYEKSVIHQISVPSDLKIRADEGDLYELLGNLLENGYKYCHRQLHTSARAVDNQIIIEIDDDGQGIPTLAQKEILKRGERLDTQREGQGLGLAIVHNIIEAYQGTLDLKTAPIGGSRFIVTFPERFS